MNYQEVIQQARHKIEPLKPTFRLNNILFSGERGLETNPNPYLDVRNVGNILVNQF